MSYGYDPVTQWGPPPREPGVILWFRIYCAFMALLYAAVSAFGVFLFTLDPSELARSSSIDPVEVQIQRVVMLVIGIPLLAVYLSPFFLPRRKWVWIFDLVLICIGLTSCCILPAAIPLLIYWIKPENRAWFGWNP